MKNTFGVKTVKSFNLRTGAEYPNTGNYYLIINKPLNLASVFVNTRLQLLSQLTSTANLTSSES